ncbi:hypothetical protein FJTKL_12216 [Diaporthe vaccinii]|uniref:Aminoglycoside phosphotransferase domain-containing protein n=1 Tax=Diaporthe vaccinii TaxID=105482 RepID=A0ABR4EES2_9PEZI
MVGLAKQIHGDLVPEPVCHGDVDASEPPLSIYSMPYLRGTSTALVEVQSVEVEMSNDEEGKHEMLIRHLGRYFARCWSNPQSVDLQIQMAQRDRIRKQLTKLMEELPTSTLSKSTLSGLIDSLTSLFEQDYPQVLTHGDFSITNILVDEDSFEITGVVDWSLAAIMPFGMDLDILFLATGFMTLQSWHDYACKLRLLDIFWEEFWAVSGIDGEDRRETLRTSAEAAGKIWAVLRMAFRRNADGSPSEEVMVAETGMEQLRGWLGE